MSVSVTILAATQCKNGIVSMTCILSFHSHVSEPTTHMDTDNSIMKERVTLIPLYFDVFVQIMIPAYILYNNMCPGVYSVQLRPVTERCACARLRAN